MRRLRNLVRSGGRAASVDESSGHLSHTSTPILLTSVTDNLAHEVTEEMLASPQTVRTGQCKAVCGHVILPAAMCAPDGRPCRVCQEEARP